MSNSKKELSRNFKILDFFWNRQNLRLKTSKTVRCKVVPLLFVGTHPSNFSILF